MHLYMQVHVPLLVIQVAVQVDHVLGLLQTVSVMPVVINMGTAVLMSVKIAREQQVCLISCVHSNKSILV